MKTIVLLALLLPALAPSLSAEWETVRHKGQDYVTARSIKNFYGFDTMEKNEGFLELENKLVRMRLTIDGQEVFMNNIKFIFISIHFQSGGRGRMEGLETLTLSPVGVAHQGRGLRPGDLKARVGNAQDSANIALATAVHGTCRLRTGRPDRGIRRARFSVLTGVKHPAITLEGGFMSHPEEARLINDPAYQKTLSRSIAEAVMKYRQAITRPGPKK